MLRDLINRELLDIHILIAFYIGEPCTTGVY
jgi:hypothetical protein